MNNNHFLVIANWKMKLSFKETLKLTKFLKQKTKKFKNELIICPSFPFLNEVFKIIKGSKIKLGAQNTFWEMKGSYTGEVSPKVLKEIGCRYVILGHSERRRYFHESDHDINKKVKAALKVGLIPILCVGETEQERRFGQRDFVVRRQLEVTLQGVTNFSSLIIAYEPVWAIGTGKVAHPKDACYAHSFILNFVKKRFGKKAKNVKIIYGGSINEKNIQGFLGHALIQGTLIGGASQKEKSFYNILKVINQEI